MSVLFKIRDSVGDDKRRKIVDQLSRSGFAARLLYPGQTRASLASIFTVPDADKKDLEAVHQALSQFGGDIEYVEASPERRPKH